MMNTYTEESLGPGPGKVEATVACHGGWHGLCRSYTGNERYGCGCPCHHDMCIYTGCQTSTLEGKRWKCPEHDAE